MGTVSEILTGLERDELPGFDTESRIEINGRYGAFGELPLHVFAVRGDYEACRILLEAGSEINVPGEYRYTPLHEAVSQGHTEVVKLLLLHGADPDLATDLGTTESLAEKHPAIFSLIQQYKQTKQTKQTERGHSSNRHSTSG